ncbi:MAG: hypothetical protein HRT73_12415 [Flavobacteriales bacterium]|nr:hypothetical protein [Flavobacteriales bacterium]NQX98664.1 hypothetical protein [Flavobacteriales bacterium]
MKGFKYIITIAFLTISFSVFSQETKMIKNRRKALAKQDVEKKKAKEDAVEEGKERHLNIQSKAVRKRMKKNAKRNKKMHKKKSKARKR